MTDVGVTRAQPVPFSHEHHVNGLGIDCRYCHTAVEVSPYAGMPPTYTCMSCHSQIWNDSPALAPVRESYRTGLPIVWTRVHRLPDYGYFNHSIHVNKGVGCASCHGQVDQMPLMWKAEPIRRLLRWRLGALVLVLLLVGCQQARMVEQPKYETLERTHFLLMATR